MRGSLRTTSVRAAVAANVRDEDDGDSAALPGAGDARDEAAYRYGIVLLLVLILVAFSIISPTSSWSRAIGLSIEVVALVVVAATSKAPAEHRRAQALLVAVLGAIVAILIGTEVVPIVVAFAASGIIAAAIPITLVGGVMRLLRARGVTIQAVAGALAVYLLVGVLFAWVIGLTERIQDTPYFVQQHSVTSSAAVYYSFTVMTTTGFGDLTAATRVGRALAVVEMLMGQIYVVVVIGLLVGNVRGRGR